MLALSELLCCSSVEVIGLCIALSGVVYGFILTSVIFTAALFDSLFGPVVVTCVFVIFYAICGFKFIAGISMQEFEALEAFRRYLIYILRFHLCASIPMILIGIIDLTEDIVGVYSFGISLVTLGFLFTLISLYCFFVIERFYKETYMQLYKRFIEKQMDDVEANSAL
ncbi:hypothetical protein PVAND_016086 [Polypedilum vanderplanki]|uniref:Uncharacterized protein n=1 Tax=Polypedilum vanderplanki TaxID=319348 RepID=A0A9J6BF49_POLVA|nr:hypothetical protein PVAND_016086 [Polypedilum vanderplanki]